MKSSYYEETLGPLDEFTGWFPRLYIPGSDMTSENAPSIISHQTLAIIDTKKEIKAGVGYDWTPVVLGSGEIQIPSQLALYLNITNGDPVNLALE